MSAPIDKPATVSATAVSPGVALLAAAAASTVTREGRAHRLIIGTLAVIALIDAIWLQHSSFRLDLGFLEILLPVGGVLLLLWGFYSVIRPVPGIAHTLLAAFEMLFFTHICGIFSYLLMGIGWPWRDGTLAAWDRLIGFDWIAYHAFLERHPWLFIGLGLLYQTTIPQLGCLILVLGFSRRIGTLAHFLGIVVFGGIVTVIVGALMPALGAYQHFNQPDHGLTGYVPHILGAHDHTLAVLDPRHFEGLVMFPSYHTVLSLAFILAAWPLRYLRYPVLLLNLLLLAGVPVFGGHYLVDMLGGVMTIGAVGWIWRRALRDGRGEMARR